MIEWVEQKICIRFLIKLEHSSVETIGIIQEAAAMGNWWLAALSQQHAHSCITSHAVFWQNIKSPRCSAPYSPDLAPCDFRLFPKLKSPLKGKRFQTISEIQENITEQLMATVRTVWGLRVPTLKGTEASCPVYWVSCILYLLQCLSFSYYMAGYLLERPYIYTYMNKQPTRYKLKGFLTRDFAIIPLIRIHSRI